MQTKSIDYEALKSLVPVRYAYRLLGLWIVPRPYSLSYRARCPQCGSSERSQTVSVLGREWHCHRCKIGGDVLRLVELTQRLDTYSAALWLCERAGVPVPYRQREYFRRRVGKRQRRRGAVGGSGGFAPRDPNTNPIAPTGECENAQ